jgi:hypothetical protein
MAHPAAGQPPSGKPARFRQLVVVFDTDPVLLATIAEVLRADGYLVIATDRPSVARAAVGLANAALLILGPHLGASRRGRGFGPAASAARPVAVPTVRIVAAGSDRHLAGGAGWLRTPITSSALQKAVAQAIARPVAA